MVPFGGGTVRWWCRFFLNQTLKYYGYDKARDFATCQVADSASNNIRAAIFIGVLHLDYNNHILNLEVKKMIKEDKPLNQMIESIHELMVSIKRSLKNLSNTSPVYSPSYHHRE